MIGDASMILKLEQHSEEQVDHGRMMTDRRKIAIEEAKVRMLESIIKVILLQEWNNEYLYSSH